MNTMKEFYKLTLHLTIIAIVFILMLVIHKFVLLDMSDVDQKHFPVQPRKINVPKYSATSISEDSRSKKSVWANVRISLCICSIIWFNGACLLSWALAMEELARRRECEVIVCGRCTTTNNRHRNPTRTISGDSHISPLSHNIFIFNQH